MAVPSWWRRLLVLLGLAGSAAGALALPRDPGILRYPALAMLPEPAEPLTLLFSDSPEAPTRSGLLYRDTRAGRLRVLAYHQNAMTGAARLEVVAHNTSGAPLTLARLQQGSARTDGPDPIIGQRTLLRHAVSRPRPGLRLAPGQSAVLFDSGPLAPQAVSSAMLDLEASGPVEISVVLRGPDLPRSMPLLHLPALPPDGTHQRGTFENALRVARVEVPSLPARLTFGGQGDATLTGLDALTGTPQRLAGNYGVTYRLSVHGAAGSRIAASPRGGLYQGLLTVQGGARPRLVLIGDGGALVDPDQPAPLWRVGEALTLEFVPANASNLPLALVFYP